MPLWRMTLSLSAGQKLARMMNRFDALCSMITWALYWLSRTWPSQPLLQLGDHQVGEEVAVVGELLELRPAGGEIVLVLAVEAAGLEPLDQLGELDPLLGRRVDQAGHAALPGRFGLVVEEHAERLPRGGADVGMRIAGGHPPQRRQGGVGVHRQHLAHDVPARVEVRGLSSASSNSGKASSRPSARSSDTIICSRELASSVLLAPMNCRLSLSYSTPTGAQPARATAWKNRMSLSACSMTKLWWRPSMTISSPSVDAPAAGRAGSGPACARR